MKMLAEIIRIKNSGPGSNHQASMLLREMIVQIVDKTLARYQMYYGGKYPEYVNVSAMRDYMLMYSAEHWKGFNPEKSKNPWAFFTQAARGNICWFMATEKSKKFPSERTLNALYSRAMAVINE